MLISLTVTPSGFLVSMAFSILLGSGFMGLIFIHGMASDYVPFDRIQCGRDRTAFLFAMLNLLQRAGNASAVAIAYACLGAFGFDATKPGESAELVRNLFVALPVAGWSIAIVVLVFLRRQSMVNQKRPPRANLPLP
jgi:glycoside/pentoside/hexuronide:cation symporter, GPH family